MSFECIKKGLACATGAQRIRRGANLWLWLINLVEESDTNSIQSCIIESRNNDHSDLGNMCVLKPNEDAATFLALKPCMACQILNYLVAHSQLSWH